MKIKRVLNDDGGLEPPALPTKKVRVVAREVEVVDLPKEKLDAGAKRVVPLKEGPQPWCTCGKSGGFQFDWQLGIYVHKDCYKPSFGYHAAAVQAGIIAPSQLLR